MDTRLVTNNFRMQQWAELIRQRQESGLPIKDWCEQNQISRNSYFYWQRKLREVACEATDSRFVKIEMPVPQSRMDSFHPELTIQSGSYTIGISSVTSQELLRMALEVTTVAQ